MEEEFDYDYHCLECDGDGWIPSPDGSREQVEICAHCGGSGID